ncbi:2-oxoadipate dioxygenase/decarboxylase [Nocardiopsis suaedae]|uniref:2-oxoadipate dioxygenase/decarboxylase n=1 Tax=Nocardiopsis suaedae TaxID=3018444 RepID=A0ABT4TIJ7_9ACTN|nr:VOC family protein [Nocardiopsis suaedae]MDA2804186.1 VOC family protein [Nocardiopsis suaedae]
MTAMRPWQLRSEFARRLSTMYGAEVPAYTTLVDVSHEVNEELLDKDPEQAQRLGAIDRVTAERHGAIRVGTPGELRQVGQVFAALGMHPVGFYDLREAASSAVPVVSTAFRPIDGDELARNPFRVFTSVLTPSDRRFFDADLQRRLEEFLSRRSLFPPELILLAERAERDGGLEQADAERFLDLAVRSFELSPDPVDRGWYEELERVSAVAADIGGVTTTHINHLTPRVLDIDELYARMGRRGITMIDDIQGPPRWEGPDVLLRQTSFKALSEPRRFREADGSVAEGTLRVRFGEVEARGIALTPRGRALYDGLADEVERLRRDTGRPRADVAPEVWTRRFPRSEHALARDGLAYFTFTAADRPDAAAPPPESLAELVDQGWVHAEPIVYEDFLPRSAAGIFQSNLTGDGAKDTTRQAAELDGQWMSGVLERPLHDPYDLYARQRERSLEAVRRRLGAPGAGTRP